MLLSETHQADIIAAYHTVLTEKYGERGLAIFFKAEQMYGEGRGRRMALKALRDGNPLDYESYFAYGELTCLDTLGEEVFQAQAGEIFEKDIQCAWANEFRRLGCEQSGVAYCSKIDGCIVRGFNPELGYACDGNIYGKGACYFHFRDPRLTEQSLENADKRLKPGQIVRKPMEYHCADLYHMFRRVIAMVLPEDAPAVMEQVHEFLRKVRGQELIDILARYENTDFTQI